MKKPKQTQDSLGGKSTLRGRLDQLVRATPNQARAIETYERILSGAIEVLDRDGWEGFNTNAVAAHVGCRVATVYRYFPDKMAIALIIAERVVERWDAELIGFGKSVTSGGDFIASWLDYTDRFVRLLTEMPGALAIRHAMKATPELRAIDDEDNRRLARVAASALESSLRIDLERANAITRTLIETSVSVVDLATSPGVPPIERAAMISALKEMHRAYLLSLQATHSKLKAEASLGQSASSVAADD